MSHPHEPLKLCRVFVCVCVCVQVQVHMCVYDAVKEFWKNKNIKGLNDLIHMTSVIEIHVEIVHPKKSILYACEHEPHQ